MFHRELKINYGMLGDLISNIESYQSALSVMKQSVEKVWELLEESSGEAYEGLEERKETILGQISSCEEELTDLHDLLAGYSYDMQSVIAPVDGEQTMVVDRNDIWFNMQSILSACDRIAAMVYNVNVPWLGTTYTAFAKEEVKEKETKYYNKLEEVQQKIQKKYQDSIAAYKDELVKLYEDKVIVYENTDDVYASKVSKDYYPKYTSLGEGILNVFEWLGDAVTGFVGGVIEGVIGVIDGIGEFLFGIGEFAVSECVVLVNKGMGSEPPDWALKNVKGMKEQVGAILDDPMLLVEGMAQGISDTYESEGIWYCAGYAVGTYAGTKGIAEAGKAVKGKVGKSGIKTDGIKNWNEISNMLRKEGVDEKKISEILSTSKGSRPDPTTYLSKEYIDAHLSHFQNGVTKIKSKAPIDTEGIGLGTFVMPKSVADDVITQAGGNVSKLEELLGLNPGDLGTNPVRVDMPNPQNIRIPSGNEVGAWSGYWTPGGYTKPGGVMEAVIAPVPKTEYVVTENILGK